MSDGENLIWTPDGIEGPGHRERIELPTNLINWFIQFNDFAKFYRIGIHCSRCEADFVAKNDKTARVFATACKCREFYGNNSPLTAPSRRH